MTLEDLFYLRSELQSSRCLVFNDKTQSASSKLFLCFLMALIRGYEAQNNFRDFSVHEKEFEVKR